MQVEGEDDDLNVRDIFVLEHVQLHLELLLEPWRRLRRSVRDAALECSYELVGTIGERLYREECATRTGKPEWTTGFTASLRSTIWWPRKHTREHTH